MICLLAISALNPALLFGTLLVISPILIHLLSKRKFRVVDWAAMDFLLDADRRNRRRIRFEHLLLLLLRCLAVILIAVLVARPFLEPAGLGSLITQTTAFERIILLDDSPSMAAPSDNRTCFGEAIAGLVQFVDQLASQRPGDTLTLLCTSRPKRPLIHGQPLSGDHVQKILQIIEGLEVTDRPAQLEEALLATEQVLATPGFNVNRVLYIVTDLRRRDWSFVRAAASELVPQRSESAVARGIDATLRRLADKTEGFVIIDVGSEQVQNLSVANVTPLEKTLVAAVDARFEVLVANYGERDAQDVEVRFHVGEHLPLAWHVDEIPAGQRASVPFTFTFGETGSVEVWAEIGPDVLPADNRRLYAGRVNDGVRILIVDGDPASDVSESETFYLARALSPPGDSHSGNVIEVVTENQFVGVSLNRFQVIFLCNLYRLTEQRLAALQTWVKDGGGLVFFLGDQVNEMMYRRLYQDGTGLFPLKLVEVSGDASKQQWVTFETEVSHHPLLRIFEGRQNPFIEAVKIFQWWSSEVPADRPEVDHTSVLATYRDPIMAPAIVENIVGAGRVLVVTTTADDAWTNWTSDPSFVVAVLEMAQYMARATTAEGTSVVGVPLRHVLDPSRYAAEATIAPPHGEKRIVMASLEAQGTQLIVEDDDTSNRGFYRLGMTTHEGESESLLFAANLEVTESDLRRADLSWLKREFEGLDIHIVRGRASLAEGATVARTELWRIVLIAIVALLCLEQLAGWWFGRRR